jgi:hypothetical protein
VCLSDWNAIDRRMQGQQRKVERRIVGGAQAQDSRPGFSGRTCQSSALTANPGGRIRWAAPRE